MPGSFRLGSSGSCRRGEAVIRCPVKYTTNKGYEVQCKTPAGHWGRHEYDIPQNVECLHPRRDERGRCYGCETTADQVPDVQPQETMK
jgi:hypothetical protein